MGKHDRSQCSRAAQQRVVIKTLTNGGKGFSLSILSDSA